MRLTWIVLLAACSEDPIGSDGGLDAGKDATIDTGVADAGTADTGAPDSGDSGASPDAAEDGGQAADAGLDDAAEDAGQPDAARGCAEIEADYQRLAMSSTCEMSNQCKVVIGHCGVGLGGCHYTVNQLVTQADLDALAMEWTMLGCTGPVCRCIAPPNSSVCNNMVCEDGP
jgi:hypothetical protein